MSSRKLLAIHSELSALRTRYDELLREMEEELSKSDSRVPQPRPKKKKPGIDFDAFYRKRKSA